MTEELVNRTIVEHEKYTDFKQQNIIIQLEVGQEVQLTVLDKEGKPVIERKFIAEYSNSHVNCVVQSKGERRIE